MPEVGLQCSPRWGIRGVLPLRIESKNPAPRFIVHSQLSWLINLVRVRLKLPGIMHIHQTFHISMIKHSQHSLWVPCVPPAPNTRMVDEGPVYSVRLLVHSHQHERDLQDLVDWEGYGSEAQQWVLAIFIVDHKLATEFYRENPVSLAFHLHLSPNYHVLPTPLSWEKRRLTLTTWFSRTSNELGIQWIIRRLPVWRHPCNRALEWNGQPPLSTLGLGLQKQCLGRGVLCSSFLFLLSLLTAFKSVLLHSKRRTILYIDIAMFLCKILKK